MKGLGKLIGNELLKLWKQTFFRVIAIILLVFIILYPILGTLASKGLSSITEASGGGAEGDLEYYEEEADYYAEIEMPLYERYMRLMAEGCAFFTNEVIVGEVGQDWKYDIYGEAYLELLWTRDAYVIAKDRLYPASEMVQGPYDMVGTELFRYDTGGFAEDYDDTVDYDAEIAALTEELEDLKEKILVSTIEVYLSDTVAESEAYLEYLRERLALIDASVLPTAELEYEKAVLSERIRAEENLLAGYRLLVERDYGPGTWQYRAVAEVLVGVWTSKITYIPQTEAYFDENYEYEFWQYESYAEYCEDARVQGAALEEPIEVINYALENDIPLSKLVEGSRKQSVQNLTVTMVGWLFLFGILIAGMTVSAEFAHGTIRLLLIRPRTRTKILLSKLLAAVIAIGSLALFAFLYAIVYSLFAACGADFLAPTLLYSGGEVIALNAFLGYLGAFFAALLPILFYMAVAFFFSVLSRKTVLSVGLCMGMNMVIGTVSGILLMIWQFARFGMIKYLPFVYMELTPFCTSLTDSYCAMFSPSGTLELFDAASSSMYSGLNVWIGVVWICGLTALTVLSSFLIFRKKQIKN